MDFPDPINEREAYVDAMAKDFIKVAIERRIEDDDGELILSCDQDVEGRTDDPDAGTDLCMEIQDRVNTIFSQMQSSVLK